jgi:putative ABC transport system substrate-binding protein
MMTRRRFVSIVSAPLLATPAAVQAQPATKVWRIGLLDYGSPDAARLAWWKSLQERLRELGYVEGQNVVYQARWGNGHAGRLPGLAAELLAAKVDILVTAGNPASLAAKQATSSIPIVTATGPDPVKLGLAASLARPGGNVTGMTSISSELAAKRVGLFKELIPHVPRMAALWDRGARGSVLNVRDTENAARSLGIALLSVPMPADPSGYQTAFADVKRNGATAVIVVQSSALFANYRGIADLALTHRLPSMGGSSEYADAGGLMSYGADYPDLFRRAAVYVDRILKGAKPADLPIEQPTKFELVINLKTAKALGLTITPSLMLRADRVIE